MLLPLPWNSLLQPGIVLEALGSGQLYRGAVSFSETGVVDQCSRPEDDGVSSRRCHVVAEGVTGPKIVSPTSCAPWSGWDEAGGACESDLPLGLNTLTLG